MLLTDTLIIDATGRLGWLAGRVLADLGADVLKLDPPGTDRSDPDWRGFNVNKRVLDLDLGKAADQAKLAALFDRADICLLTPSFDDASLAPRTLRERHPALVVVSITPFGSVGPRHAWRASDLELMAAGGAMALAGEPDGEPLRISEPQSPGWAGAQAAVGALTALYHRAATGRGDLVDVSAQACVVGAIAHAPAFFDMLGEAPTRAGAFITGRSIHGARYRVFWPCRDGFLNFIFYGGQAGRRTNAQLVAWMRERGAAPRPLAAIDWDRFDPTKADQAEIDALEAPVLAFFAGITKREFLDEAHRREMLGYPVSTVADIAADPQLEARGFFTMLRGLGGTTETSCGSFAVIDGTRPPLRYAAGTAWRDAGEASARDHPWNRAPSRPDGEEGEVGGPLALAGLKVVCFGGYAAGPHVGKVLANFGARVVHVESRDRPDGFRLQYPPFAANRHGINRSGCFAYFNDSKYGVTVDLKKPVGVELARRLVTWSDIVVENMRPGVMARLGLGYDALAAANPRLVMLSTCNMGQTGPRADKPGFGSQLSALGGFCGLTGFPDAPPMLLYGPYIDFIASALGCAAVLAGAIRARASSAGTHIDLSQYESGLTFMAGALQDYFASGHVRERCGNRDRAAAPHGAYPCRDREWVALSCWSDVDFAALAHTLGDPVLTSDARFATTAARCANDDALNAVIAAWTRSRSATEVAEALQAIGVAAYPVVDVVGLFADPQLLARRQWRRRPHPEIGDRAYCLPGFDLEGAPGDIVSAAPCLGADNQLVFRELLGVGEADMMRYAKAGVFG